ncbi:hypothetical protein [Cribrihabitans neustonicus]|uniref:hypothetical protein n=1 Tax=Cribrihabitans neustonicus TaxID=1429085 RepID=UPI003B59402D
MSAPDTNTERQKKRHRPALFGIWGVVIFALILLVGWLILVFARGGEQDKAEEPASAAEVQTVIEGASD